MNEALIQEIFELVAEIYIDNEGEVTEGELDLLNNTIEVLFFE